MEIDTIPSSQEMAAAVMRKVEAYRSALAAMPEGVSAKSTGSLRSICLAAGVAHDVAYRIENIAKGGGGSFSYETVHVLGSWLDAETSRIGSTVASS